MYIDSTSNTAKVNGVLLNNTDIRNEHLRRNLGKYFQYTDTLSPAIGEVYNIDYDRKLHSSTNELGLLNFTHFSDNPLSEFVNQRFFDGKAEKEVYGYTPVLPAQLKSWCGQYGDYRQYIDEVLGDDTTTRHVRYVNNILAMDDISNALRMSEVGVVRDLDVVMAMQGINTTNHNNVKGIDTKIGQLTNYFYSHSLYGAAIFNSDRHSEEKYITPTLVNQYGNTLANVSELGDMLRVGVNELRLREDLGADAKFVMSDDDINVAHLNHKYLDENIENAEKYIQERFKGEYEGYVIRGDGYVTSKWGDYSLGEYSDKLIITPFKDEFKITRDTNGEYHPLRKILMSTYGEGDAIGGQAPADNEHDQFNSFEYLTEVDNVDLLSKTNDLFLKHEISTLISRFHTSNDGKFDYKDNSIEFIDTAKSAQYGNSHGRNLLTRDAQEGNPEITNGYDNPYCRVWTHHHQYNQYSKLIRPFMTKDEDGTERSLSMEEIQTRLIKFRSQNLSRKNSTGQIGYKNGAEYLAENTVLNSVGRVNIAPTAGVITPDRERVPIEKCMFSIENLAWKDVPNFRDEYLTSEQRGPNGGRIMWFPPYALKFNESVSSQWNENTFIGRGEPIYTYTNSTRQGQLSFDILVDHPSMVNLFSQLKDSDGGKGLAVSDDIDADILRFFAGCDIPDLPEELDPNLNKNNPNPEDPERKLPTQKIKFRVHFPNNFSGSRSTVGKSNDIFVDYQDWWKYLLLGNNNAVFSDKSKWRGYESQQGMPVSDESDLQTRLANMSGSSQLEQTAYSAITYAVSKWNAEHVNDKKAQTSKNLKDERLTTNNTYNKNWIGSKLGVWSKYWFFYLTDYDLHQKFWCEDSSYRDTTCYRMNTLFQPNSYHKNGITDTFGEIIYALLESGRLKSNKDWNGGAFNRIDGVDIDIESLKEYLKSANVCNIDGDTARKTRSEELIKLFTQGSGMDIVNINLDGGATQRDHGHADMLARRRCQSVRELMEYCFRGDEFTFTTKSQEKPFEDRQEGKTISCAQDKMQRSVVVTIEFIMKDQMEELHNLDADQKPTEIIKEEQEEQNKFDTWYKEFSKNNTIFDKWKDSYNSDKVKQDYDRFAIVLKSYMDENQLSYNVEDYDDNKWFDLQLSLLSEEGLDTYDSFILSAIYGNYGCDDKTTRTFHQIISDKYKNVSLTPPTIPSDAKCLLFSRGLRNWLKENKGGDSRVWTYKDKKSYSTIYTHDYQSDDMPVVNDEIINRYPYNGEDLGDCAEIGTWYDGLFLADETDCCLYGFDDNKVNVDYYARSLSSELLWQDYNVLTYLYNIDDGFECAVDYIFGNKENGITIYEELKILTNLRENLRLERNFDYFKSWEIAYWILDHYNNLTPIDDILEIIKNMREFEKEHKLEPTVVAAEKTYRGKILLEMLNPILDNMLQLIKEAALEENELINQELKDKFDKKQSISKKYNEIIEEEKKAKAEEERIRKANGLIYQKLYTNGPAYRYETEAEYFNNLKEKDPLIFKSLKDKYKYFDPAFHSMSPEGFNARLTFLQQCMRQGATLESSSWGDLKVANNLAFGRMPVCVLRIGDFINTKIVIQSMNIEYGNDGATNWDLNPEGIGVQPMYARVSLGIMILGGQSLVGPINRLQNAVTFDYYANTGVYDDRADLIHMDEKGNVTYTSLFTPEFKDGDIRAMNGKK